MTMLYTHQPSAIHTFDHNACNRSTSFQDQKKPAAAAAPLQYRTPAPVEISEKRSSKPAEIQTSNIVMPCPKKVSVLCSNAFLGGNPIASPVMTTAPHWRLSSLVEDTQEEESPAVAATAAPTTPMYDQDNFFDQDACAELMEIMSSNGSSRASSQTSSPQPSLESLPMDSTVPLGLFEEHAAFFGTPSIVRTNNPLPNDESFNPYLPDSVASDIAQRFLARHRYQAKVFDFNLNVDEVSETQAPSRSKLAHVGVMV